MDYIPQPSQAATVLSQSVDRAVTDMWSEWRSEWSGRA